MRIPDLSTGPYLNNSVWRGQHWLTSQETENYWTTTGYNWATIDAKFLLCTLLQLWNLADTNDGFEKKKLLEASSMALKLCESQYDNIICPSNLI